MKDKTSRRKFIGIGGLALAGTLVSEFAYAHDNLFGETKDDRQLLQKLVLNNDNSVRNTLDQGVLNVDIRLNSFRSLSTTIAIMTASVSHSKSEYYQSKKVTEWLNNALDIMLKGQYEDGTMDAGGNRQSPPDTAFVLEPMCAAAAVLNID